MSNVWKKNEDHCQVLVWADESSVREVRVHFGSGSVSDRLNGEWRYLIDREDLTEVYPCKCSIYTTAPARLFLGGIPVPKITVFCIHEIIMIRFHLMNSSDEEIEVDACRMDNLTSLTGNLVKYGMTEDEIASTSFLLGILPREYEEIGESYTGLSKWFQPDSEKGK